MKKLNLNDFGTVLLKLRTSLNWTQISVGQEIGLSQKSYSDIENNITELSLSRFLHLSAVFNVHPFTILQEIIQNVPEWNKISSENEKLLKSIDKLNSEIKSLKDQNKALIELCKNQSEKPCANQNIKSHD